MDQQTEASMTLMQTRLAEGMTAQGVDATALPWAQIIQIVLGILSGGCPPKPTPPTPAQAAQEIKAANPFIAEIMLARKLRQEGYAKPRQTAAGIMSALNKTTSEELKVAIEASHAIQAAADSIVV